jgi:hypothetical protein
MTAEFAQYSIDPSKREFDLYLPSMARSQTDLYTNNAQYMI